MDAITELNRKLNNLIRYARISAVEGNRCQVTAGGLSSAWLPWLTQRAGTDATWWAPSVGEQVLWIAPGGMPETGVILPGIYQSAHPAPSDNLDEAVMALRDGFTAAYNTSTQALSITVPDDGQVTLVVNGNGKVVVDASRIDLGQSDNLEPSVLGNKLAAWVKNELKAWLDTHQHTGNLGAPTSAPLMPFQEGSAAKNADVYSSKNRNQ